MDLRHYSLVCNPIVHVCFLPHLTKTFPVQLWLKKFYYFLLFIFIQKNLFPYHKNQIDNHTTNSSKVHIVTLMVERSLGIPNVPKVIKERKKRKRKNTQNKSKTHGDSGERHHMTVSVFSHCQLQMYFSMIKYNST